MLCSVVNLGGKLFAVVPAEESAQLAYPPYGVGGEDRGHLVPHIDNADALLLAGDQERRDVAAGEGEDPADAMRLEDGGDQLAYTNPIRLKRS